MKTRSVLVSCFLFFAMLIAVNAQKIQESKVPQDVVISFRYKYPDATISSWEKAADNYVAKFKMNNQGGDAEFDNKGVWIETRYDVKEKELPSPVLSYYKENYYSSEYTMSVIQIHKTSQGKSFYFIQVKREGVTQLEPVELQFDLAGKLIYKNDPGETKALEEKGEGKQTDTKNKDAIKETQDNDAKYMVDATKVPAAAKSHFLSKNKKAAMPAWYFKDQTYTVKFNTGGKNGLSTYTKEGSWRETRIESSEDKLNQLTVNYLKEEYRQYKIKSVENVTQPKDKFIYIRMYDKRSKAVPPPLTEIWFTSAGKFINVEKPEITDPYELEEQKRRDAKDKEFMEDVDKSGVMYEDADNYNDKVNKKELPSSIVNYVKQNYKEHIISSSRLVSDDKLGNVYQVVAKIEGAKYGTVLFFDIAGNLVKKYEESENRMNTDKIDAGNENNAKQQTSKYGTADERISESELPSEITK